MRHTKKSQTLDFSILGLILTSGLVGYITFSHQPTFQIMTIGICSVAYVLWGVWHHQRLGNLIMPIIIEYILVGVLALALITSNLLISQ